MERLVVTPREAAEALFLGIDELKRRLESGEIPAYRDGRNWKIPIESLKAYAVRKADEESRKRRRQNAS